MNVDIGIIKVRNPQSETFKTLSEPYKKFLEWLRYPKATIQTKQFDYFPEPTYIF